MTVTVNKQALVDLIRANYEPILHFLKYRIAIHRDVQRAILEGKINTNDEEREWVIQYITGYLLVGARRNPEEVLQSLNSPTPNVLHFGLCVTVFKQVDFHLLCCVFLSWPKHSGNDTYPVPSPEQYMSTHGTYPSEEEIYWAYRHNGKCYLSGAYGELRRELMEHTKQVLRTIIVENQNAV